MTLTPTQLASWEKWSGFKTCKDACLVSMLTECASFIMDMKSNAKPRWLSFLGNSGTGKSFLARRVWRWYELNGKWFEEPTTGTPLVKSGQFCVWPNFLNECRQGDHSRKADLITDHLVILDEVGADNDKSGFSRETLFNVLNARVDKWTVITSNMPLKEIADRLDARIASRLIRDRNKVVTVKATDYALRKDK